MSSTYGPIKWYRDGTQSFHADAGRNLPTGVTLTNAAGATATVKKQVSGVLSDVTGVTVGGLTVATGRLSGTASVGLDYTLTPGATPPDPGSNYYVWIIIDRSDSTEEVIEQPLVIR